jgi:Family of unknown function (DUF5908)
MPLEIRELVIKVTVNDNDRSARQDIKVLENKMNEMKSRIVKECVDKVIAGIKKNKER